MEMVDSQIDVHHGIQDPKSTKDQKAMVTKLRSANDINKFSPTIDIVSRITNVLKISKVLRIQFVQVPSSYPSLEIKFMGTVRFGNDQFAPILGYGDLNQGNVTIRRVYYVEGLNHNLFSVGQFCDADLEVAFRKSTCFVRDLQGNNLLTGSRGLSLLNISSRNNSSTPICYMLCSQLKHGIGIEDLSHS
ncbi:hypothetical protein Tco_0006571 [Tanacetum coccineum]